MTQRTPEFSVRDLPYTNLILIKSEDGKFLRLTVLPQAYSDLFHQALYI